MTSKVGSENTCFSSVEFWKRADILGAEVSTVTQRAIITTALLGLVAVFCGGCVVPSIHPLYSEDDVTACPGIVGIWLDQAAAESETWKFFKKPGENTYTMIYIMGGKPASFTARFTQIDGVVYMDTYPISSDEESWRGQGTKLAGWNLLRQLHLLPVHLLWRIDLNGDVLRLSMLDPDMVNKQISAGSAVIAHEYQEVPECEPTLVLTAQTSDLREFLAKNGDKVFNSPIELHRKK